MMKRIKSFVRNEEGPTAVEYAVMLALILLAALAAIALLGQKVSDVFVLTESSLPSGSPQ